MNATSSVSANVELPPELIALGRSLAALPAEQARACEAQYAEVVQCFQRRRRVLTLVQEALSQLRLDVKYLMFDLDATRQERDALRLQLDAGGLPDDFDNLV
jgi:hypothetical protein